MNDDPHVVRPYTGMLFDTTLSVMAHDEAEAKRLLAQQMIDRLKSGDEEFVVWLDNRADIESL